MLTATGTLADVNPIRYRGYYYDTESGFYYLQSRYYDPNTCRFINADGLASTGQGFLGCNMFAYCLNNPVNFKDSCGAVPTYCVMLQDGGGAGASSPEIFSSFSELTITVSNTSVEIDAYMVFEGDIDKDILINGIKDYWEGDYDFPTGTKTLTVNIHCGTTSEGRAIYVNSKDKNGRGYTNPAFRDGGVSKVTVFSRYDSGNNQNIGWEMAHEFGHCLGIEDYYTHSGDPWYEPGFVSIMHTTGKSAQLRDLTMAIDASKTGVWQLWEQWY